MLQLSNDLEAFVQAEIDNGRFACREDVFAFAVQMLKAEREETVAGIQQGLADVAAGRKYGNEVEC